MEWAAFNENDDSQRRERNRHHHLREGDFDDENDQNQKQGLIRGENENNNDAETQKRKRRTAEAEETRIAGSYETAIRLLAEEEEEDNNNEGGGENVILKEEAKREEAKQILLAVVNHEMMRENDELTPTLCSVKKLALRNLGNLFAKECGEFEFEEEEFEGSEDDKDDSDDDGGEKQRREKLSSKSSVSSQSYSFEQAIRCYSEAVRMDREDVASWLRMGELSAKRGDVALARMAFESGLLAQPTHALLLNELCEVCVLVGDEASATFLAARILNSDRRNERMKEIQTNFANAKPKERLVKARERFERVNARKDISAKGTKCALTLERMAWDDVASSILGAVKVKVESEESAIRAKDDDDDEEEDDDEDDDEKGVAAPSTPPESSTPTRVSTPSRKGTSSAARSAGLGVPVEFVTSDTITEGVNKNKNKKQKVTTKEKTPTLTTIAEDETQTTTTTTTTTAMKESEANVASPLPPPSSKWKGPQSKIAEKLFLSLVKKKVKLSASDMETLKAANDRLTTAHENKNNLDSLKKDRHSGKRVSVLASAKERAQVSSYVNAINAKNGGIADCAWKLILAAALRWRPDVKDDTAVDALNILKLAEVFGVDGVSSRPEIRLRTHLMLADAAIDVVSECFETNSLKSGAETSKRWALLAKKHVQRAHEISSDEEGKNERWGEIHFVEYKLSVALGLGKAAREHLDASRECCPKSESKKDQRGLRSAPPSKKSTFDDDSWILDKAPERFTRTACDAAVRLTSLRETVTGAAARFAMGETKELVFELSPVLIGRKPLHVPDGMKDADNRDDDASGEESTKKTKAVSKKRATSRNKSSSSQQYGSEDNRETYVMTPVERASALKVLCDASVAEGNDPETLIRALSELFDVTGDHIALRAIAQCLCRLCSNFDDFCDATAISEKNDVPATPRKASGGAARESDPIANKKDVSAATLSKSEIEVALRTVRQLNLHPLACVAFETYVVKGATDPSLNLNHRDASKCRAKAIGAESAAQLIDALQRMEGMLDDLDVKKMCDASERLHTCMADARCCCGSKAFNSASYLSAKKKAGNNEAHNHAYHALDFASGSSYLRQRLDTLSERRSLLCRSIAESRKLQKRWTPPQEMPDNVQDVITIASTSDDDTNKTASLMETDEENNLDEQTTPKPASKPLLSDEETGTQTQSQPSSSMFGSIVGVISRAVGLSPKPQAVPDGAAAAAENDTSAPSSLEKSQQLETEKRGKKAVTKKAAAAAKKKKQQQQQKKKPPPTQSAMKKAELKKAMDPYESKIRKDVEDLHRLDSIIAQCLWCAYGVDLSKIITPLGFTLRDCRREGGACEVPESFLSAKSMMPDFLEDENERNQANYKTWTAQRQRAATLWRAIKPYVEEAVRLDQDSEEDDNNILASKQAKMPAETVENIRSAVSMVRRTFRKPPEAVQKEDLVRLDKIFTVWQNHNGDFPELTSAEATAIMNLLQQNSPPLSKKARLQRRMFGVATSSIGGPATPMPSFTGAAHQQRQNNGEAGGDGSAMMDIDDEQDDPRNQDADIFADLFYLSAKLEHRRLSQSLEVVNDNWKFLSSLLNSNSPSQWSPEEPPSDEPAHATMSREYCYLLKYDLCYNPKRVDSWRSLAVHFDAVKDVVISDGGKMCSAEEFRTNDDGRVMVLIRLHQSWLRACLHATIVLLEEKKSALESQLTKDAVISEGEFNASSQKLTAEESEAITSQLELVKDELAENYERQGMAFYENLQNCLPFYDGRREKIERETSAYQHALTRAVVAFKRASSNAPETYLYDLELAKCYRKQKEPIATVLHSFKIAVDNAPEFLEPLYQLHAARCRSLLTVPLESRGKATESNTPVIKEVNKYRFLPVGALAALPPAQQKTWATAWKDANMALKKIKENIPLYHKVCYRLARNSLEHNAQIYEQLSRTDNRPREGPPLAEDPSHAGAIDALTWLTPMFGVTEPWRAGLGMKRKKTKKFAFSLGMMVEMEDVTIGFGSSVSPATSEVAEAEDEDRRNAAIAAASLGSKKYDDDGELYVQLQTKVCISSIGQAESTRRYVAAVRRNCSLFTSCCYSLQDLDALNSIVVMLTSNKDARSKKKTDYLFRSLEDLREATLGRSIRAVASVIAFNGGNDDDDETKLDDEDTVSYFLERAFELYIEYGIPSKYSSKPWNETILPYMRATYEEEHMTADASMTRLLAPSYEAAFHGAVQNIPLDYAAQITPEQLTSSETCSQMIPVPLQEKSFEEYAMLFVNQVVNHEDISGLLIIYMQLQQKLSPNARWEYMVRDESVEPPLGSAPIMRAATDKEMHSSLSLKESVRDSLGQLCVQKLLDHMERKRKTTAAALKKNKKSSSSSAAGGKNKVLNGIELLIEDSYEAEGGLSDSAKAVGDLDYCLYAAITLYDEIKYEAKCLKARYEREVDTYAILMANPDSSTYKQAVHGEKEQDLRRACDEAMLEIKKANTQENMEAFWLSKKILAEWQDENRRLTAESSGEVQEARAKIEFKARVDAENLLNRSEPAKILVKVVNALLTGVPVDGSQTAPTPSNLVTDTDAAYQWAMDACCPVDVKGRRNEARRKKTQKSSRSLREVQFRALKSKELKEQKAKEIANMKKKDDENKKNLESLVQQASSPAGKVVRADAPDDHRYEENEDF
jgi:hypothetical protein